MPRYTAALVLLGAVTLGGCGAVDPYVTIPRNATPSQPTGTRVAICYNTLSTSLARVQARAQQQCPAGTVVQWVDTDWYLQYCPILIPARATFVCTMPKK